MEFNFYPKTLNETKDRSREKTRDKFMRYLLSVKRLYTHSSDKKVLNCTFRSALVEQHISRRNYIDKIKTNYYIIFFDFN